MLVNLLLNGSEENVFFFLFSFCMCLQMFNSLKIFQTNKQKINERARGE